jgi:AcrR family transcriptional regulator
MPKIIHDVRGAVIAAVRDRVASEGWKALEIRSLAASCGIAAGTLYNYFPSRQAIAAAAIREDWLDTEERIDRALESGGVMERLEAVYGELAAFLGRYRKLWMDVAADTGRKGGDEVACERRDFQARLVRRIGRALGPDAAAEGVDGRFLPEFLARAFVHWAQDPRENWDALSGIVRRLIKEGI